MGMRQSMTARQDGGAADDSVEVGFDNFQILRAIGKGSFGKVCIIQKRDTKKMYAMKYMSKSLCVKKDAVVNVLREIELLKLLEHPFLVNLWFTFQDDEDMFVIIDLLLGGDLRYHLQQETHFDTSQARLYLCELALALEYLQQQHIVHRDLKPDNILLDSDGHAHLTDFNVATVLAPGGWATSISGTKPYMAPEVFACAQENTQGGYSYAVDWWSLGVTIYEILKGKRPYDIHGDMSTNDVMHLYQSTVVQMSSSWDDVWKDIFRQLLTLNPTHRLCSLTSLKLHPLLSNMDLDMVLKKEVTPTFVPKKNQLNCDPTYELEEMIVETQPLHKKKKRLANNAKSKNLHNKKDLNPLEASLEELKVQFKPYNRLRDMKVKATSTVANQQQRSLADSVIMPQQLNAA